MASAPWCTGFRNVLAPAGLCLRILASGENGTLGRLSSVLAACALVLAVEPATRAAANDPSADASPPGLMSETNCQDEFRVNSSKNKDKAIKKLHQCSAIEDIGAAMENFMFWYITLPASSRPESDARFQRAIDHNTEILTGAFIGLKKDDAVAALDKAVIKGLKRGRRDDLINEWLSSHNAKIFKTETGPSASENAIETRPRPNRPEKATVVNAPARNSVKHPTYRPARTLVRSSEPADVDYKRYDRAPFETTTDERYVREMEGRNYNFGNPLPNAPQPHNTQARERGLAGVPQQRIDDGSVMPLQAYPPIMPPISSTPARIQQQPIYPTTPEQIVQSVVNVIDQNARIFQQTVFGVAKALGPSQ